MTINLPVELEGKLRERARIAGIPAERFVIDAVADRLSQDESEQNVPGPDASESDLLQAINRGPPEAVWRRYHDLMNARRAGTLTSEEHSELIRLSDAIEVTHVARLELVVRLARLRNARVDDLMAELGLLQSPPYE